MTDCNRATLQFSSLGTKTVVADFQGGRLTTDAGALLLREPAERIGLFDALDAAIPDPRHPLLIIHDRRTMIARRVTAIAPGHEDLHDHQALRTDPGLRLAAGKSPEAEWPLASPPTPCRPEDRVERPALVKAAEALVDQFLAAHATPPGRLILDFDATDGRVHGEQEGRSFHGCYDHHRFLPLYAFCGDELLAAYLRPSDVDAARRARAALKLPVRKLRAAWPDARITARGDSGLCRWRLMRWRDSHGTGYVLGPARNPALRRAAAGEIAGALRQLRQTGQPRRLFGTSPCAASSRDRARRVTVKAGHHARGSDPRFIAVNVPGDPQGLDDDVYCQRGEMGNRTEERQLDPFADRTGCRRFLADQFRLLPSSAAYVLVRALRRMALAGAGLSRARVGAIRLRVLKVAARVAVGVRRVVLHLASGCPYRAMFEAAPERLTGRASVTAIEGG